MKNPIQKNPDRVVVMFTVNKQVNLLRNQGRGMLRRLFCLIKHFLGVFRINSVLHQFSNMALAALLAAFSSAAGFGSPNRNEGADRFVQPFLIGVDFSGNFGIGVEVLQKNFPRDHFGQPKFKGFNRVEKFLAAAEFGPVVGVETGGELSLSGIGSFDCYHTQFEFLVSSNRLVGKNEIRPTQSAYHHRADGQFQNSPKFIIAWPACPPSIHQPNNP